MIEIDMPMPENCRMCPVCSEYDICLIPVDGKGFGEQNVSEFTESRPEWCPMKEQEAKTHGAVCCKDCMYGEKCVEPYKDDWCNRFEKYFDGDWFCKDGAKRSDDDGQKEGI